MTASKPPRAPTGAPTSTTPSDAEVMAAAIATLVSFLERVVKDRSAAAAGFTLNIPKTSALARVIAGFQLSRFETAIVVLCAAIELQPGVDRLCGQLGNAGRPWPSFALALAVLPEPHWTAIAPSGPLRGQRLLALAEGEVLTERALRIEERVLHALLGHTRLEPALARRLAPLASPAELAASLRGLVEPIATRLRNFDGEHVQLVTAASSRALALAATAATFVGLTPWLLDGALVPAEAAERDELARLWSREVRLAAVMLVVVLPTTSAPGQDFVVADFVRRLVGPRAIVGAEPPFEPGAVRIDVHEPTFEDRVALWQAALGDRAARSLVERLAAQFALEPEAIAEAARSGATSLAAELPATMWSSCRAQARPRMAELAQRVEARAQLDDVVLPETQRRMLDALVSQVRARARVHHAWGFEAQSARGSGTAAVFAGPSGTGKTMAAEGLAAALALDLYRIDLSAVVSKYIGETEENLRKVFDAAEAGGAVLLFDEADALFGKRTEVRDSHDRHANIEVSYLLQRMEAYRGLAILTTNMRKAIDDAFLRRVQFIIDFPFPDTAQRERIWATIFPAAAPLHRVDFAKLARLAVAGGNIRSIARNAAYLAADSDENEAEPRIEMKHLLAAARIEYAKLGRSLPPAEIRGWVEEVQA
jgi:AAA+ superfamily predicted ATPase